jgi:hypothetical protein
MNTTEPEPHCHTESNKKNRRPTKKAWLAAIAAVASLGIALVCRMWFPRLKEQIAPWLLSIWALVPPVWFYVDWARLNPTQPDERDYLKHLHDLARNIWLAYVVVLAAVLDVKWPGGP